MPRLPLIAIILTGYAIPACAQVSEIKSSSHQTSASDHRGGGSTSGGSGGGFFVDLIGQVFIGSMVSWQQQTLSKRESQRSLISLDGWLQAGGQPSSYYLVQPRIRANWGIVSTDFRSNYVLEEDIKGLKHIRTSDWQVIQLNMITAPSVTFRMGIGVMVEGYEQRKSYPEWTAAFQIHPQKSALGGFAEYRSSEARDEVNGHVRYHFSDKRKLHPYVLAGAMWQRYYDTVNVWGVQAGVGVSLY